ncbi:MAG: hypothetical protein IJ404_02130 [Clostridia bacterium]|nr:hypothetical protein [Clostridia bacterium]
MNWEIALGVIALLGFAGSIATWVSKLSKTLAILETTINTLNKVISEFKNNSHNTHKEMFARINSNERVLENHEGRLKNLEQAKKRSKKRNED